MAKSKKLTLHHSGSSQTPLAAETLLDKNQNSSDKNIWQPRSDVERDLPVTYESKRTRLRNRRRRKWRVCACVTLFVVAFLVLVTLFFLFADVTYAFRMRFSKKTGIALPGYQKPKALESVYVPPSEIDFETSPPKQDGVDDDDDVTRKNENVTVPQPLDPRQQAYVERAEYAWQLAWEILNDDDGWKKRAGNNLENGIVNTKRYEDIDVVYRLEVLLDCAPADCVEYLGLKSENFTKSSPDVEQLEILERIRYDVEIEYSVIKPPVAIISKRDLVMVRHWKTKNGVTLTAMQSIEYNDKPESGDIVRALQKIGGVAPFPVEGDPHRSLVKMIVCPDLRGWVPLWAAEMAAPEALMQNVDVLKSNVRNGKLGRKLGH